MPTHIHISTPFMVVAVLLALGLLGIIVAAFVARGRRKSEERRDRAAQAHTERMAQLAVANRADMDLVGGGPRSGDEYRARTAERPYRGVFSRSGGYSDFTPTRPATPGYSATPAPAAPVVVQAGGQGGSSHGSDMLLGGMAGFMVGNALGGSHGHGGGSSHHTETIRHEYASAPAAAPAAPSDSGFTWNSGSSSNDTGGGFDMSFGD